MSTAHPGDRLIYTLTKAQAKSEAWVECDDGNLFLWALPCFDEWPMRWRHTKRSWWLNKDSPLIRVGETMFSNSLKAGFPSTQTCPHFQFTSGENGRFHHTAVPASHHTINCAGNLLWWIYENSASLRQKKPHWQWDLPPQYIILYEHEST